MSRDESQLGWVGRVRGAGGNVLAVVVIGVCVMGLSAGRGEGVSEPAWAMREAADAGDLTVIEGASVEELGRPDPAGVTPLTAAARCGKVAAVEVLLRRGVDINARGGVYGSALVEAALFGETESVRVLLRHGADVGVRNGAGRDALMNAAACGDAASVRMLLAAGADAGRVDRFGGTALSEARQSGDAECVRLLSRG